MTEPVACGHDCEADGHDYGYGAECIHQCGHICTADEALAYGGLGPGEVPNRTWYEVYWPGPRELHASCDPWGTMLRGVDATNCPVGDCDD